MLFKKGLIADTGNYRSISVLSASPKLYDCILNVRFTTWYMPYVEQAGAQPGHGCEEQLLTLRLYIDIARKTKRELYILFVDYQKAYDNVNRKKLLMILSQQGCGNNFLRALGESLKTANNVLGSSNLF